MTKYFSYLIILLVISTVSVGAVTTLKITTEKGTNLDYVAELINTYNNNKVPSLAMETEQKTSPVQILASHTEDKIETKRTICASATNSIVDFFVAQGLSPSFTSRAETASKYNIPDYRGTTDQNTQLLTLLREESCQ